MTMKFAILTLLGIISWKTSDAFTNIAPTTVLRPSVSETMNKKAPPNGRFVSSPLYAITDEIVNTEANTEVERLQAMAARLRAEAAALEEEKAQQLSHAAGKAFQKFDKDSDGKITLSELKAGLEKTFKMEIPDARVRQLLGEFDTSGDGVLKRDEFVTVEQFRNKLNVLAQQERAANREAEAAAKLEADALKLFEAQMEIINDRSPTTTDKLLSTLPYLFPLLDGLQFASFLVAKHPDNAIATAATVLFALYRSIPFGGLIAFTSLSFLSGNLSINRLIRFNMQQAISLDICLFFVSIIATALVAGANWLGVPLPPVATELGSDAIFLGLLAATSYSIVSSLLGQAPDKIPFISDSVSSRIPTVDMFDVKKQLTRRNDEDDDENEGKTD